MSRRRLLLLVAILAVVAGFVVFLVISRSARNALLDTIGILPEPSVIDILPSDETGEATETNAENSDEFIFPVDDVLSYYAYPDRSVVIVRRDGTIVRVIDAAATTLSATKINDISWVAFSPTGNDIAVTYSVNQKRTTSLFAVTDLSWRELPQPLLEPVWDPSGRSILSVSRATSSPRIDLYLFSAARPTQSPQLIWSTAQYDTTFSWLNERSILVTEKVSALSPGSTWIYNTATKKLTPQLRERFGLMSIWDSAGSTGLVFFGNPNRRGGNLEVTDGAGTALSDMSFITLPSKCSFFSRKLPESTTTIPGLLCAVPKNQERLTQLPLPDSYLMGETYTNDVLVGLSLDTQSVFWSYTTAAPVDATAVKATDGTLYFINRYTQRLHRVNLGL